eukprot:COSAG02_NODE_2154_length_9654_cov_5.613919_4_plen_63_part_00
MARTAMLATQAQYQANESIGSIVPDVHVGILDCTCSTTTGWRAAASCANICLQQVERFEQVP